MILCHVCHAPIANGWLCGPPPAAAGLGLGLCPEHDTPANREVVLAAWESAIQRALAHPPHAAPPVAAPHPGAAPGAPALHGQPGPGHALTLQFLDGGVVSVSCDHYEVDQDRATLVCRSGDALEFFPLQHLRRIRAVPRESAQSDHH